MRNLIKCLLLCIAFSGSFTSYSCPVCEKQQPKILQGITHGTDPQSNIDYLIVLIMAAIVIIVLFLSIKFLVNPGEKSEEHIKRFMLNNN